MGRYVKFDKKKEVERRRLMKQIGGGLVLNFMFKNWENLVNINKKFL